MLEKQQCVRSFGDWLFAILDFCQSMHAMEIDLSAFACLCALTIITGKQEDSQDVLHNDIYTDIFSNYFWTLHDNTLTKICLLSLRLHNYAHLEHAQNNILTRTRRDGYCHPLEIRLQFSVYATPAPTWSNSCIIVKGHSFGSTRRCWGHSGIGLLIELHW